MTAISSPEPNGSKTSSNTSEPPESSSCSSAPISWPHPFARISRCKSLSQARGRASPRHPHSPASYGLARCLLQWLETHSGWLLIFDNADDLAMLQDYLPAGTRGHVLPLALDQPGAYIEETSESLSTPPSSSIVC